MIVPIRIGRGRGRQRTLDEAKDLVQQWEGSDLSKEAWCRERGILCSALHSCLRRVREEPRSTAPTFIRLRSQPPPETAVTVQLSIHNAASVTLTLRDLGTLLRQLSEVRS